MAYEPQGKNRDQQQGTPFGLPRLDLPTFSLRPAAAEEPPAAVPASAPASTPATAPTSAPAPGPWPALRQADPVRATAPPHHAPPPGLQPAHLVYASAAPAHALVQTQTQAQTTQTTQTTQTQSQMQPLHAVASQAPQLTIPATRSFAGPATYTLNPPPAAGLGARASSSHAAAVVPAGDGFLGGRITPVQLGLLVTGLVMVLMIANGAPAPMNTGAPASLPAAATPVGTQSAATLPLERAPVGVPSPAAAAALLAEQKAKRAKRGAQGGMTSAATAGKLAAGDTETLPLVREDGNSLPPSSGARDSHANESHYSQTLPMEAEVARPAITPGEAAAQAEMAAIDVSVGSAAGGYGAAPNAGNQAF